MSFFENELNGPSEPHQVAIAGAGTDLFDETLLAIVNRPELLDGSNGVDVCSCGLAIGPGQRPPAAR